MNRIFCEDNGNPSLMRFIAFLTTVAAIFFGGWAIAVNSCIGQDLAISFLSVAFLGKFSQKAVEQKSKNIDLSTQDLADRG